MSKKARKSNKEKGGKNKKVLKFSEYEKQTLRLMKRQTLLIVFQTIIALISLLIAL